MDTVSESITTVDDGPGTVNERLTSGGPGPEGQPDTAMEILSAPAAPAEAEAVEAPAHSAVKAEWVAYAVTRGADPDEAESSTKAELIESYG